MYLKIAKKTFIGELNINEIRKNRYDFYSIYNTRFICLINS